MSTRVEKVVSRCFVVDTDVSDSIAVLELEYVEGFAVDIDSVAVLVQSKTNMSGFTSFNFVYFKERLN